MSAPDSDLIQPFLIDAGAIRGRMVRLGSALDTMLAEHDYPSSVAALLGETVALAVALAGALKYDGIFTLQVQAEGAVSLLVADVTSDGDVRAYARYDAERLAIADRQDGPVVPRFLEKGYLAFTVDQGPETDRYQGIVELGGDTLADCAEHYFEQSEQLDAAVALAVRAPAAGHGWQAGAVMIQRMPTGPNSPILTADEAAEAWNRAVILLSSLRPDEMFDTALAPARLLYRLYHADGLALHEARPVRMRCRCSAERVSGTLRSFPREEVDSMKDETGRVVVVCEFCKSRYVFADQDLDRLYGS